MASVLTFEHDAQTLSSTSAEARRAREARARNRMKGSIFCGSIMAMCFSILEVADCSFMTTTSEAGYKHALGLFSRAAYEYGEIVGCISLTHDIELDGMYKTARAFGVLTAFCATAAFFSIAYTMCFCAKKRPWNVSRGLLIAATICQLFTYSALGSKHCVENECRLSGVGVLAVFNVFVLACLAITVYIEPPPTQPLFVMWSDDLFTVNKDTLAKGVSSTPEFMSSEEAEVMSQQSSIFSQARPFGTASVASAMSHASVQESLVSSISIQKVKSFRLLTVTLMAFTWVLSIVGVRRCTFLMVGSIGGDRSDYMGIGLFTRAVYEGETLIGCLAYSDTAREGFNSVFQTSRVFGAVAALLMTVVVLCGVLQLFTTIAKDEIWMFIRALLPCTLLSQMLAFLAFLTRECTDFADAECVPGTAGVLSIMNVLLVTGLSILSCALPPPPNPVFARWHGREEQAPTYPGGFESVVKQGRLGAHYSDHEQEEHTRQGSLLRLGPETISVSIIFDRGEKKTVKEITHADGSKTITTTIEELDLDEDGEEVETTDDSSEDNSSVRGGDLI